MWLAVFQLIALMAASWAVLGAVAAAPPKRTRLLTPPSLRFWPTPAVLVTTTSCIGRPRLERFCRPRVNREIPRRLERIVQRVSAGEMPPRGVVRPPQERIDAFVAFVESAFDRADRGMPLDPGRVTAGRLNRSEYSNTIRDLLACPSVPRPTSPPTTPVTVSTTLATYLPSRRC